MRQPFSKVIVQYIHNFWQGKVKVKVRGGRPPLFPRGSDCWEFLSISGRKKSRPSLRGGGFVLGVIFLMCLFCCSRTMIQMEWFGVWVWVNFVAYWLWCYFAEDEDLDEVGLPEMGGMGYGGGEEHRLESEAMMYMML
jgi:hypothetical protein